MQAYGDVRALIMQGNVRIFKSELVHVLYKKYIALVKSIVQHYLRKVENSSDDSTSENSKYGTIFEELFKFKSDFCSDEFPLYKKELLYLEQLVKSLALMPAEAVRYAVEKDQRYRDIVADSFVIFVSQYAFNVLETMDKMRRKEQNKGMGSSASQGAGPGEILYDLRNNIKVADNLTLEAYTACPYINCEMRLEEIQKVNSLPYYTGLVRDDFVYFTKLEDLFRKKSIKDDPQAVGILL